MRNAWLVLRAIHPLPRLSVRQICLILQSAGLLLLSGRYRAADYTKLLQVEGHFTCCVPSGESRLGFSHC